MRCMILAVAWYNLTTLSMKEHMAVHLPYCQVKYFLSSFPLLHAVNLGSFCFVPLVHACIRLHKVLSTKKFTDRGI